MKPITSEQQEFLLAIEELIDTYEKDHNAIVGVEIDLSSDGPYFSWNGERLAPRKYRSHEERDVVAMLYWKWRKRVRMQLERERDHQDTTVDIVRASVSWIDFADAYRMVTGRPNNHYWLKHHERLERNALP